MGSASRFDGSNNDIIEDSKDCAIGDGYFWSLVSRQTPKKRRKCLKCKRDFLSSNYGHRKCSSCIKLSDRYNEDRVV